MARKYFIEAGCSIDPGAYRIIRAKDLYNVVTIWSAPMFNAREAAQKLCATLNATGSNVIFTRRD